MPPLPQSGGSAGAPALPAASAAGAGLTLTPRLWLFLVLLGILWGGSFFFTQVAIAELPPLSLVAGRVSLAAAALLAFIAVRGISLAPLREHAGALFVLGVVNNAIPFTLLAIGQTRIAGGLASILNATAPLWTILAAALLTSDERLTANRLAGVALGIAGVALLIGPDAFGGGEAAPLWAFAAIIAATLSYAFGNIYAKRFKGIAPVVVAAGQLSASSLLLLPLGLLAGGRAVFSLSPPVIASMLALALASTAFAYILYFELVAKAGATNTSLVAFLVPPSAILLGILVLGESLSMHDIAGFALVLSGLAAVDGRLLRLARRKIL